MDSHQIKIRPASLSDFEKVFDFINQLENTEFEKEHQEFIYRKNLSSPDNIYLVAASDNLIVGFISCHIQYLLHHGGQKIGEIQEMYVAENSRSRGVGKELLDTLKKVAKETGIVQLEVTSGHQRGKAHSFYEREGFLHSHKKFTLTMV